MKEALRMLSEHVETSTGIWLERGGRLSSLARLLDGRADVTSPDPLGPMTFSGPEGRDLINAITVSHTWFFRDGEQMRVIGQLLRDGWPAGKPIHLWVPGCATGEDAYSLALLAEEAGRPAHILATDINTVVLNRARDGRYSAWALRDLPERFRQRFCADGNHFRVDPSLARSVSFEWHNLIQPPPRPENGNGWDLILCRNVLIYFRFERAIETLRRLGRALSPGSWLLLGSSEVISETSDDMEIVQLGPRVALRRAAGDSPGGACTGSAVRPAWPSAVATRPGSGAPASAPPPRPPPAQQPLVVPAALAEERGVASDAVSRVSEGNGLLDAGDAAAALESYALAQGLDPLFAEAHFFSGVALHLLDDPQRAADALRSALLLSPSLWPACFYLAICYQSLGLERDAILEYERLLASVDQPVQLQSRGRLVSDLHAWKQEVRLLATKRIRTLSRPPSGRVA